MNYATISLGTSLEWLLLGRRLLRKICHRCLLVILVGWRKYQEGSGRVYKIGTFEHKRCKYGNKMQCSRELKAVMPHRVLQHIMTWTNNFLYSVSIFVDLEGWNDSDIFSTCNRWASINIHLNKQLS